MTTTPSDPLLAHFESLERRVEAWRVSWERRGQADGALVAELMSRPYLGEPLSAQIERRLTEARRELENQLARYAGTLAAGIALLCRAGDTERIERDTFESFSRLGRTEEAFETKMAELRPMVELYRRLNLAVGPNPRAAGSRSPGG